jgi:hypothetical protein
MKNAYLNNIYNFRVYLRVIKKQKKKQKYIVNKLKKRRKIKTK